ncbi:unnamed protein product [Clavelina lepadiformis]|uniref:WD repeat-containing protein 20 n=1 Tax=Clavelina lepadiformis TaxID=159417 RepID=A0ABP0FNK6_CLALP
MPVSEYFYPKRIPYAPQVPASSLTPVKTSFVKVSDGLTDEDCICFTVGRELFYFFYKSFKQEPAQPVEYLDKRTYKGVAPTCHDINQFSASADSVRVAVGFIAGQVQIIDVRTKESLQIMNEDRSVEKSRVTCVKWFPNSENILLAAHISGFMYTYDITQPCANFMPQYHSQPYKSGNGYSIYTLKTKNTTISSPNSNGSTATQRNPVYKWVMSTDGSGVNAFEFSPCDKFVAVVTQSGYLRIIDHSTFDEYGCMKSYFGGLLTCSWSPDGRYVVTGGEDDLVTVWSFCDKCVIARGSGHRSWVSEVAFDPYCCTIPSDADMKAYYGIPSVSDIVDAQNPHQFGQDSDKSNSMDKVADAADDRYESDTKTSHTDSLNDVGIHLKLNGDMPTSLANSAIRRLRTYSNVSKLSRLSIGVEGSAPSLSYRFGSVGQDAQLCLWELDENALFFLQRSKSVMAPTSQHCDKEEEQNSSKEQAPSNFNFPAGDVDVNGLSGLDYSGDGSSYHNQVNNYHHRTSLDSSAVLVPSSRSSSVPHSINASVNQKERKHSSKLDSSNSLSAIRKFATIGTHDRSQKEAKEHKRNLSLPHFGFKSSANHTSSNTTSKIGFLRKPQPPKVMKTFGTNICPCLDDTPMLVPLICKKVSQGRLTCLDFKDDCVVTTCQDGYIQLWKRPEMPHNVNSPTASTSSLKEQIKPSGTTV